MFDILGNMWICLIPVSFWEISVGSWSLSQNPATSTFNSYNMLSEFWRSWEEDSLNFGQIQASCFLVSKLCAERSQLAPDNSFISIPPSGAEWLFADWTPGLFSGSVCLCCYFQLRIFLCYFGTLDCWLDQTSGLNKWFDVLGRTCICIFAGSKKWRLIPTLISVKASCWLA